MSHSVFLFFAAFLFYKDNLIVHYNCKLSFYEGCDGFRSQRIKIPLDAHLARSFGNNPLLLRLNNTKQNSHFLNSKSSNYNYIDLPQFTVIL